MTNNKNNIVEGIDISKSDLDVAEYDGKQYSTLKIKNTKLGIKAYLNKKRFINNDKNYLFIMEATGVYSLLMADELSKKGFNVAVENPLKIKRFSEMKMIRAKTDVVDSKSIALYGYEQTPALYKPKSRNQRELVKLLKGIEDLDDNLNRLNNQLETFIIDPVQSTLVINSHKSIIKFIGKKKKHLETKLNEMLKEVYPDETGRLVKIKGVEKKTAAVILAFFGKFEHFETVKQVVSYIGTNPSIRQSGTSVKGRGNIDKKGNRFIRKKLYMSALSASRYNPSCMALYSRLTVRGKEFKQKIVAVMNKLVRQIFAVLKYDREWEPNYSIR
jgi:transposase